MYVCYRYLVALFLSIFIKSTSFGHTYDTTYSIAFGYVCQIVASVNETGVLILIYQICLTSWIFYIIKSFVLICTHHFYFPSKSRFIFNNLFLFHPYYLQRNSKKSTWPFTIFSCSSDLCTFAWSYASNTVKMVRTSFHTPTRLLDPLSSSCSCYSVLK